MGFAEADLPLGSEQRARVEAHLGLVEAAATALGPRLRTFLDRAELVAAGRLGLVEAARHFDPGLGVPFLSFATFRVRGAMFDAAKKQAAQGKTLLLAAQSAAAYASSMIPAPGNVLASNEEQSLAQLRDVTDGVAACMFAVLAGAKAPAHAEDAFLGREQRTRARDLLRSALHRLDSVERVLVERHYFEAKDLKAVGAELGLSYSTARRRHFAALLELGGYLRAAGLEGVPDGEAFDDEA